MVRVYDNMKSIKADFISGPVSLSYHPDVYGRKFYIFGDFHYEREGDCPKEIMGMTIEKFFDTIFRNTNVLIDFYLENEMRKIVSNNRLLEGEEKFFPIETSPNYIGDLIEKYSPCLKANKIDTKFNIKQTQSCIDEYPNYKLNLIRFHYVDIRQYDIKNRKGKSIFKKSYLFFIFNKIEEYYEIIKVYLNETTRDFSYKLAYILKVVESVIDILSNMDKKMLESYISINHNIWYDRYAKFKLNKNVFEKNWKDNRIKKQIEKIESIPIKRRLLTFFGNKIDKFLTDYNENQESLINTVNIIKKSKNENITQSLIKTILIPQIEYKAIKILHISVLYMDMYTLARIFSKNLLNSKEVWLYAGELHAKNYRDFIINYLQIPERIQVSNPETSRRCLDITTIKKSK